MPCPSKRCTGDIMFIKHLEVLAMGIEIFFKKEGATEKGGLDFEIGDLGAFANLC